MTRSAGDSTRISERIAGVLLRVYKTAISPILHAGPAGGGCAFQPTCSEYAAIAVAEHGMLRGGAMAAWRLLRCNPLHRGGFDPVRPKAEHRAQGTGHGAQGAGRSQHSERQAWTGSQIPGHR